MGHRLQYERLLSGSYLFSPDRKLSGPILCTVLCLLAVSLWLVPFAPMTGLVVLAGAKDGVELQGGTLSFWLSSVFHASCMTYLLWSLMTRSRRTTKLVISSIAFLASLFLLHYFYLGFVESLDGFLEMYRSEWDVAAQTQTFDGQFIAYTASEWGARFSWSYGVVLGVSLLATISCGLLLAKRVLSNPWSVVIFLGWATLSALSFDDHFTNLFQFVLSAKLLSANSVLSVIGLAVAASIVGIASYFVVVLAIRVFFSFYVTVAIAGLIFGTMALVVILGVMGGFEKDLRDKILGVKAHMRIEKIGGNMTAYREIGETLEALPELLAQAPFYETEAILAFDKNPVSVIVRGIDPKKSGAVLNLEKDIEKGSIARLRPLTPDGKVATEEVESVDAPVELGEPEDFSSSATPDEPMKKADEAELHPFDSGATRKRINTLDGILVGRELAMQHEVFVDQAVQMVSPLTDITPAGPVPFHREYRVAGQFYVGMVQFDLKYVYVSLPSMRRFLDLEDEVSGIELRLKDPDDTEDVKTQIKALLGPEYRVQDWQELDKALFSAMKLEKKTMFLVLVLAILVAAFSVLGNLIMIVVEKGREIAILKAIGVSGAGVKRIFMAQGLTIGIVGSGIGTLLGTLFCILAKNRIKIPPDIWYIDVLPIQFDLKATLAIFFAAALVCVLATLYPAHLAASLKPVKGLKDIR